MLIFDDIYDIIFDKPFLISFLIASYIIFDGIHHQKLIFGGILYIIINSSFSKSSLIDHLEQDIIIINIILLTSSLARHLRYHFIDNIFDIIFDNHFDYHS